MSNLKVKYRILKNNSFQMVEITVSVFGDSHLAQNHSFQGHFSQLMQSKGTVRYFYNIKYFAQGGAQINESTVAKVKNKMHELSGQPHIAVVGYGGNNLRNHQSGVQVRLVH
jgi:hypothetical protein